MIRMIMHGCNGRMGQMISEIVREDPAIEIIAGIDINRERENEYPVFECLADCSAAADVVIDFGAAPAMDSLLDTCVQKGLPVVVCTTGLSDAQIAHLERTAERIAVLYSANMSLGINLLLTLLKEATKVLAPAGFDVEIIEKHHRMKVDAPSGTALALADAVNEAGDNQYEYVYDRSRVRQKRGDHELGISAVRGGSIVGDHDVIFAGTDEVITFSHSAYSRAVFGKGAVLAAKFLAGKPAGLYTMSDVIENA